MLIGEGEPADMPVQFHGVADIAPGVEQKFSKLYMMGRCFSQFRFGHVVEDKTDGSISWITFLVKRFTSQFNIFSVSISLFAW